MNFRNGLLAATVLPLFALTACGGGGGGRSEGPTTSTPATPAPPAPPPVTGTGPFPHPSTRPAGADAFETTEYRTNPGLATIKASSAYALGSNGAGVTVAVIDSGVDLTHPELQGKIAAASTDVVVGRGSVQDQHGHGTTVAGVVAAASNGTGVEGVAWGSTVLAVRADQPGQCNAGGSCTYLYSDVANALRYAADHGAKIVNLSLGSASGDPALQAAYQYAVSKGVLIVGAAGNSAGAAPDYPGRYAATDLAAGQGIAAGAVDANGQPTAFTSHAGYGNIGGNAQSPYPYLMAPGQGVVTTTLGGGLGTVAGTSYASPAIAGAAAVVMSDALRKGSSLTAAQVVDILVKSATRIGTSGFNSDWGWGVINLEAALNPIGALAVPLDGTVAGASAGLGSTQLRLGAAFGNALQGRDAIGGVMVLDEYKRAYIADLGPVVAPAARAFDMMNLVSSRAPRLVHQSFGAGTALTLGFSAPESLSDLRPYDLRSYDMHRGEPGDERVEKALFATEIGGGRVASFGTGLPLSSQFGVPGAMGEVTDGFLSDAAFASPYLALVAEPQTAMFAQRFAKHWDIRVGGALDRTDDRSAIATEIGRDWPGGSRVSLQYGTLQERGGVLASSGDGALTLGRADTQFVGLAGGIVATPGVRLLGSYNLGWTDASHTGDSLLGDMGTLRSSSWSLGVAFDEVARAGDRVGLALARPLRVDSGSTNLSVPVARTFDGTVLRENRRVGLVPTGEELDAELSYLMALGAGETLGLNLMLQMQPGHDASAGTAGIAAVRYHLAF